MKLKEIHRTSTFSFYPTTSDSKGEIWLATGTVAGALDASFSNESLLEIWAPQMSDEVEFEMGRESEGEGESNVAVKGRLGKVAVPARFNSIGWGSIDNAEYPKGIIAGGLDTGELVLHDPAKIIAGESDSLIFSTNQHTSALRALAFNTHHSSRSLLCTASTSSEIFIWNLASISSTMKPYSPGARSTKLDEVTCLGWNKNVPYVLASGSNSGYCVVWDLRGKREVVALSHLGSGAGGGAPGGAGRSGVSDVCWHPENATRLLTSTDSDSSPIISLWDLRNARAPEKSLTGHSKGILSMDWCAFDSGLLMSCGKDKRGICWNVSLPSGEEILGELPPSANWSFQIGFHPTQPSILANASYDGTISLHTLQSIPVASDAVGSTSAAIPEKAEEDSGADIFDTPSLITTGEDRAGMQLMKQTPKWMQVPVGVRWGYGGKLIKVSNGKEGGKVTVESVKSEERIVQMAKELQQAADSTALKALLETKLSAAEEGSDQQETYQALLRLFSADSRAELVKILGFEKGDVEARVKEGVQKLKDEGGSKSQVVSFKEPAPTETEEDGEATEAEVPEASAAALLQDSASSDPGSGTGSASATTKTAEADTEIDGASTHMTEPSLFGGEDAPPAGTDEDAANFFSSMGPNLATPVSGARRLPHMNPPPDSSVAATAGSRRTSLSGLSERAGAGESTEADGVLPVKNVTFRMYPPPKITAKMDTSVDQLLTRSLVIGDFESAVELCLSSSRWADAILLATRGPPSLLQKAQKAYFEKMTLSVPYLRLYQSIVGNDLDDIVQNCDLREWKEIFVILSTFAKADEFWTLSESLGERIEFAGRSGTLDNIGVEGWRKNAIMCYLASGKLERVVGIWLEQMSEDEARLAGNAEGGARYSAHAEALQVFIEKITFFRAATKYVDSDLSSSIASISNGDVERTYKLSALYDRYFEYADLLAAQGLVKEGLEYVNLTPLHYKGTPGSKVDWEVARERLNRAAGVPTGSSTAAKKTLPTTIAPTGPGSVRQPATGYPYDSYANVGQIPSQPTVAAGPYGAPSYASTKAPIPASYQQPSAPSNAAVRPSYGYGAVPNGNGNLNPPSTRPLGAPFGQTPYGQPPAQGVVVPPPPPPISSASNSASPQLLAGGPPGPARASPPIRKITEKVGGWNDPPPVSRSPANVPPPAPVRAAITSPFPQSQSGPASPTTNLQGLPPPPPPRGATPLSQQLAGPPRPSSAQNPASMPPPPPGRGPQSFQRSPGAGAISPPPGVRPMGGAPPNAGFMPPPGRIVSPPQGFAPPPMGGVANVTSQPIAQSQMMKPPEPSQAQMPPPPGRGPPVFASPPQPLNAALPPVSRPPPGPYGPPPVSSSTQANPPVPQPGGPPGLPRQAPGPPAKPAPPKPKYPPGDRTHIPDPSKPIFEALVAELDQLKQTTPPTQRRMVEDLDRRLNMLFDALNCETLSQPVIEQLQALAQAVNNRNRDEALGIHMNLLTTGSKTDDIGVWMSGVKQLLLRM